MLHSLSPFFAIIVFGIAFLTAYILNLFIKFKPHKKRNSNIDSLRGFLGLGVFIHHASIWYGYIQTGEWVLPDSVLYTKLGQASVSFFFMISSYLFTSKLIALKSKNYDWVYFFKNRFLRLAPLYFFSVTVLLVLVLSIQDWSIVSPLGDFLAQVLSWYGFAVVGQPDINNVVESNIILGVVWSLSYEWLLYFCLPLISIVVYKKIPNAKILILSIVFLIFFVCVHSICIEHIMSFLGGIIACLFPKKILGRIRVNSIWISVLQVVFLVGVFQFGLLSYTLCLIMSTLFFVLIANGNDLFGVLKNTTLKFLGEISYSTYLLHSLLLFILFYFGFGMDRLKEYSSLEFCFLIIGITPVVVLISVASFYFIEKPFIKLRRK